MHSLAKLLFVSFSFFLPVFVAAQQSSAPTQTPQRDPQAVTILQAAVGAMGGTPPSDSTVNGTVTAAVGSQTQNGTIQILTRGTNQSLESISLPDLSQTTVYSYPLAGQTSGSSAQQELTGQLAATSQTALYPLPLLVGALNNPDASLQYVGQETVDGAVTQHIRFWNTFTSKPYLQPLAPFSVHDVWINTSTGFPVKISFTQQAAAGSAFKTLVELDFSNYQQTNGFAYPYTIKKSLNGTQWLTISIQSVSFNTGLQYSQFQVNCSHSN
jgi:hypothetical protein